MFWNYIFIFNFAPFFHNLIVNRPAQSAAVCLFCMTSSALRTEISTADIVSWLSSQLVAKNRTAPFLVKLLDMTLAKTEPTISGSPYNPSYNFAYCQQCAKKRRGAGVSTFLKTGSNADF